MSFTHVYRDAKKHHKEVVQRFRRGHKHANRLLKTYGLDLNDLRHHAVRTVALAGIASSALVGPAYARSIQVAPLVNQPVSPVNQILQNNPSPPLFTGIGGVSGPDVTLANQKGIFTGEIKSLVPHPSSLLQKDQADAIQQLVNDSFGLHVSTELDGISLNANYGAVGAEQHLKMYPGDTANNHELPSSGMAGGLGAWGYFAPSKSQITELDKTREEWYGVVQTFLTPGWNQNTQQYYEWFHHRKIAFINPNNGNVLISSIEDSGPNQFLDRKFGVSPEGIDALGYGITRKGPVYVFFVDDPDNKVPLGPLGGK